MTNDDWDNDYYKNNYNQIAHDVLEACNHQRQLHHKKHQQNPYLTTLFPSPPPPRPPTDSSFPPRPPARQWRIVPSPPRSAALWRLLSSPRPTSHPPPLADETGLPGGVSGGCSGSFSCFSSNLTSIPRSGEIGFSKELDCI